VSIKVEASHIFADQSKHQELGGEEKQHHGHDAGPAPDGLVHDVGANGIGQKKQGDDAEDSACVEC
jgi:hypothetical protein